MKRRSSLYLLGMLCAAIAVLALFAGCSEDSTQPTAPDGATLMSAKHPGMIATMAVQNRHTPLLMTDPEIVGTATGLDERGKPAIYVLLKSDAGRARVPAELEGVHVIPRVTGEFTALKKPQPSSGHTARYPRPIPMGVSGGNAYDLANNYCCSGTLGALVAGGGTQYILSNSHVLCGDVASSSGDPDIAEIGDPINQPGMIDVQCQAIPADYVANLSTLSTLIDPTANVDCALAEVIPGMVSADGTILEIGVLSSQTMDAYVDLDVKKSGRTTGLTRSYVYAINGTVNVGYQDECNGVSFTKLFTGQIMIYNKREAFLAGGDSGSLLVEDVSVNPRAVGLCFAGSRYDAIANPIDDVLAHLGVSMVGN
ncbi:MAG: hypothetical protein JW876_11385 [Candidatus Krumholzibacteriota bacterium]|nr:hypothetical protein [Candidatus Krumholzibacteriota bacterium]